MSSGADSPRDVAEDFGSVSDDENLRKAAETIGAAFPDIKCLRCGHDSFFLLEAGANDLRRLQDAAGRPLFDQPIDIVELVCRKCGMVEKHSMRIIAKADKPISSV